MVDFDLVKRVAKTLDMSEQQVMQTHFVELIEMLVDKNNKLENENEIVHGAYREVKEELDYNSKGINDYCIEAHDIAKSKGWYDMPVPLGTSIALIHSEVSEALEALRKDDLRNFAEELADVCIRTFDLSGYTGINLGKAIDEKMEKNRNRSYKHGGKRF